MERCFTYETRIILGLVGAKTHNRTPSMPTKSGHESGCGGLGYVNERAQVERNFEV
jgi:hypothetical protein